LISSIPILQGCAHSALEKHVDQEVTQESAVKNNADLRAEADQLIETAPGLSADQRARLSALRNTTRAQTDEMWAQSLKLRSVLIKDLITTNYNEDEVELIKQRIRNLEDKRLSLMFSAVERANTILGRQAMANPRLIDEYIGRR
jgi:hypothetical protein